MDTCGQSEQRADCYKMGEMRPSPSRSVAFTNPSKFRNGLSQPKLTARTTQSSTEPLEWNKTERKKKDLKAILWDIKVMDGFSLIQVAT